MPEIDVSDVVVDPDVAGSSFTVLRRQEVVSEFGISETLVSEIPNVLGSVQPTGDNSLIRDEAYDAKEKTLKVITSFRLRGVSTSAGGVNYKPDQILWDSDTYEVRTTEDYSAFGGGLIEADCVQVTYVGHPPGQLPPVVGKLDFSQIAESGSGGGSGD